MTDLLDTDDIDWPNAHTRCEECDGEAIGYYTTLGLKRAKLNDAEWRREVLGNDEYHVCRGLSRCYIHHEP